MSRGAAEKDRIFAEEQKRIKGELERSDIEVKTSHAQHPIPSSLAAHPSAPWLHLR
jgi:hypothetical protein